VLCMGAGTQLAVSSHGSTLHIVGGLDAAGAASLQVPAAQQLLAHGRLPLRCVAFLSETRIVAGGFDGQVPCHFLCAFLIALVSMRQHIAVFHPCTPSKARCACLLPDAPVRAGRGGELGAPLRAAARA
jgi:hypothetical protein